MKRKLFAGLLAGMLVCLAFVLTNASSSEGLISVSGTAKVYLDGEDMETPVQIQVFPSDSDKAYSTFSTRLDGSFEMQVLSSDRVTYSYSEDESNSVSQTKTYARDNHTENISLHFIPGQNTRQ